jgi:hypothetical protein
MFKICGPVPQWIEDVRAKLCVGSSSLPRPTCILIINYFFVNVNYFVDKALALKHKYHYEQIEHTKTGADHRLSGRG